MTATLRKAAQSDVDHLYLLIQKYAESGIMLPRSREALARQMDTFVVVEIEGQFVGCGSLCRLGNDLVEIRSLGISDGYKGQGLGRLLVDFLLEEARTQGIPKVMALTYEVGFFERLGFTVVNKEIFPEKVWTDCVNCKKQDCCDEIAMLRLLG